MILILMMLLASCSADEEYTDRVIEGENTYVTLRMSNTSLSGSSLDDDYFDSVGGGCGRLVAKCDKLFSAESETSILYALNNKVDMIVSPDESLVTALNVAVNMATATDGAYTPTAGKLCELWSAGQPDEASLEEALRHTETSCLSVRPDKIEVTDGECIIDLHGIREGFAAQRLMEYLTAADVAYGVVSVGDSVGVFGQKPEGELFKLGVSVPGEKNKTLVNYSIKDGFISVSDVGGDYPAVDPRDGTLADSGIVGAAVWSNNGAVSDALSEAVIILGEAGTFELYLDSGVVFEAMLITENKEIIVTGGIEEDRLEFVADGYTVRNITRGE